MINKKDYIKISFTGDIMIEHTRLKSFFIKNEYDFKPLFYNCKSMFEESDYVVGNLETPVAGERLGYSYKDYNFNTPESILKAIKSCGIDMVTTANNHVLDRGIEGIDETIKNIEKVGLEYTGTSPSGKPKLPLIKEFNIKLQSQQNIENFCDFNRRCEPLKEAWQSNNNIPKSESIKVAFLSYTYGTEACYNLNYLNKNNQYRVNLLKNQELQNRIQRFLVRSKSILAKGVRFIIRRIVPNYFKRPVEDFSQDDKKQKEHLIRDIQYCKNNADYIVMCLHSGGQYNDYPTNYTKKISDFCFENGVDLIVCNHEHIIQESLFSRNSKKNIAFCLGNYSCDYGIIEKTINKSSQCSVFFNLYINKYNSLKTVFFFCIFLSKLNENNQIITVPLYDEFESCKDENNKNFLIKLNNEAVSRFIGKPLNLLPQKEYFINNFGE